MLFPFFKLHLFLNFKWFISHQSSNKFYGRALINHILFFWIFNMRIKMFWRNNGPSLLGFTHSGENFQFSFHLITRSRATWSWIQAQVFLDNLFFQLINYLGVGRFFSPSDFRWVKAWLSLSCSILLVARVLLRFTIMLRFATIVQVRLYINWNLILIWGRSIHNI